jgi:hypothetical protein
LYRRPSNLWLPVIAIILIRFLVANFMALSGWRYTLSSLALWLVVTITFIGGLFRGLRLLIARESFQDKA